MSVKLLQASSLYMPEYAARASTNTTDKIRHKEGFLKGLLAKGHLKVFEFANVTFEIECSISCASQMRTHRSLSIIQQSTRYVDGSNFDYDLPRGLSSMQEAVFINAMLTVRNAYRELKALGVSRDVRKLLLPQGVGTRLVVEANLRSILDFISKRNTKEAHEEIRGVAEHMELLLKIQYPELF